MWKKKEKQLGRCGIAHCLRDEDDMWYIDSRISHNMLGDKIKFHFLNWTKSGCVVFQGNESARELGSGKANIGEKRTNADKLWIIKGINNNILSVSQMVNGGKEVIFNSKFCIIEKEGSKIVISMGVKTLDNVYVLKGRVSRKRRPRDYSSPSY